MDFAFSEEQQLLRASAREFLTDVFPVERVSQLADSDAGWDPDSWKQLVDLGWLDPELGPLEHAVLFEETGAALYPGPFFSTVALGSTASTVPRTLAWAEPGGPARIADAARTRTSVDNSGRVSGHKVLVPDAASVERILVVARDPAGECAVWEVDAADVQIRPCATTDHTRRMAEVSLDGVPAEKTDLQLARIRLHALAAAACEAVGVARRALEISTAHAIDRIQFERPIGSYQGVSHRVANSYLATELARSLAYWAAWCVAEQDEQAAAACAAAKSSAAEAAVLCCEGAIQVLGGSGFTWEQPLHRFYKRARWLDAFDGHGSTQRAELAEMLLGPVG